MIRTRRTALLVCLSAVLFSSSRLFADTLQVSSGSDGSSVFDVLLSDAPVAFNQGGTITVSNLSGVSDVNYVGYASYFGTLSNTDNSVTFTFTSPQSYAGGAPLDLEFLRLTSVGTIPGNAIYTIQEADRTVTGKVQATPTPEPSGIILLGTGLAGVVWLARRRLGGQPVDPHAAA